MNFSFIFAIVFKVMAVLWNSGGREIARKYIDNPAYEWDDCIMNAADQLFGNKHYAPKVECAEPIEGEAGADVT